MSWWQSDTLHLRSDDGKIVISNLTAKQVQPFHMKAQYGDGISRKA